MTFPTTTTTTSSPSAYAPSSSAPPICQNCTTSTTPLWRRDEAGSVLCNACGLFLKLHGKPRPISLKTDVIKSRNRVKNSAGKKKSTPTPQPAPTSTVNSFGSLIDLPSHPTPRSEAGTPPPIHSRAATPSLPPLPGYDPLLEHTTLPPIIGAKTHGSGSCPPSPPHPTVDGLIARNNQLKTRVAELELVNDLFRGRVSELETSEAAARRAEMAVREVEANLRAELAASRRREEGLKRRVEELERGEGGRKKVKVSDLTE